MADLKRERGRGGPWKNPGPSGASSAASFAGLGIQLVISILLFLYLGQWLDKKFGTDPMLLVVGVFAGAALGIYNMYHVLTAAHRKAREEKEK